MNSRTLKDPPTPAFSPSLSKADHFLSFITAAFSRDDFLPKGTGRLTKYIQLLNQ